MHAILDLEPDRSDTEAYQSLKEALVESGLCSLLAHDHRAQLAVIAN